MNDRISIGEVATMVGVSTRTAYAMLRSGDLPGTLLRGRWIISRSAVSDRLRELGLEVTV